MPVGEMPYILVVDDDTRLRELLRKFLSDNGFRVTVAADASEARNRMAGLQFDLIILDRMMPGESGLDFAKNIQNYNSVAILMLTAMGEVEARIDGLEAGVDDYLAKPFEPRELLLRIRTILRRLDNVETLETRVRLGLAEYDPSREVMTMDGQPLRLTSAEAGLLSALAAVAGEVLTREELTELCNIEGGE